MNNKFVIAITAIVVALLVASLMYFVGPKQTIEVPTTSTTTVTAPTQTVTSTVTSTETSTSVGTSVSTVTSTLPGSGPPQTSIVIGQYGTLNGALWANGNGVIPTVSGNSISYGTNYPCPPEPTLCQANNCWLTGDYQGRTLQDMWKGVEGMNVTFGQYLLSANLMVSNCVIHWQ